MTIRNKSNYIVLFILSLSFFNSSSAADITHIDQTVTDGSIIKSGWFSSLKSKVISINSAGDGTNVGIGKASSPSYKLDVAGRVNSNGYCIDGDCRTAWPWASNGTQTNFNIGNVGIGTYPTSTYKLDVAGSINSTGICINGECKDNWEPDSPWTISGDNIYYTGGNVGIGTSNPTAKLQVDGIINANLGLIDEDGGAVVTTSYPGYDQWEMYYNFNYGLGFFNRTDGVYGMMLNNDGNVGIGSVVSPTHKLQVGGDVRIDGRLRSYGNYGWYSQTYGGGWRMIDTTRIRAYANKNILTAGTVQAGAFVYNSDKRLKTNIKDLNDSNDILKISAKRFDWKDEKNKKVPKNDIGVIAQDVEKYFPEFVETDENGIKSVNYPKLVVPLISVVKEQQNQINKQQDDINLLKKEIENFKKLLK